MTFGWSLRQLRLEWASINQTFASWYITISRKIWRAIIRRQGAQAGTDCQVNACCCSAQAMWPSSSISSTKKASPKRESPGRNFNKWFITPRLVTAGAVTLLGYFGETHTEPSCEGCDNCLTPRETFDGTIPAQKFLSCVHRIHAKSGFGFGVNHIVDVLRGADTEAIRQRNHNELSTYGIGRELKREAWQAIGRELLRLGLIECAPGKFATLSLTPAGRDALRHRTPITLTKQIEVVAQDQKARAGAIECDEVLFERLRGLRRQIGGRTQRASLRHLLRCLAP